ncbi:MAG: FecR domain-containing protein [Candidatus Aminicenantes bacterium]|nr:FecR domain-containing protein [Candidatus Aminicenantes bacterium]
MRKTTGILIAILFFFSISNAEETKYTNNSFARLSYVQGDIYIQRSTDLGYEEGIVNMPVSEGDRMGTTDGRAEIYLGNGNYVRLDNETKIDFLTLPKIESELIRIRVWTGNIYFRVKDLKEEKNIEIHTTDVSIYVLDNGLYRIDVRQGSETEIFVFEGTLEAAGESDSILINNEQRVEVSTGHFISQPTRFHAVAEDSFDRWSEHRDSQVRKRMAKAYLPEELEDFEYELSANGEWVHMAPHGHVWVPGGIDPYWRPYYNGRWTWLSLCGWTWIPYESWGWSTHHFGRWHWRYSLGWYWIPTRVWGPAWVSWYWGYDYFGWAPLSYYGYPGVIINNMYYGRFQGRYYPYNSRALTVIHKNQLKARNVSKAALSQKSVKSLGKISLSRKRLPMRPTTNKISIERLDGKKVLLRKKITSPESEAIKRSSRTTVRKTEAVDSNRVGKKTAAKVYPSQERKVVKKKSEEVGGTGEKKPIYKSRSSVKKDSYGYTSSRKVSAKKPIYKSRSSIKKNSYGYPSSRKVSANKPSKKITPKKSSSFIGRIYKNISGSSKSVKSRSSRSSSRATSSKRVSSSSSKSRSSSSKASKKSSSSSSRSASKSGKVKKKN